MPKIKDAENELAALHAAMTKRYGSGVFHRASESLPINRIPFVEPQLNYATFGGIPFGRFTSLTGHPMAGKSRVALELVAQAQQLPGSAEVYLIPRIAYHSALIDETSLADDLRREHEIIASQLEAELDWIRLEFPNGADAVYYNAEMEFDEKRARSLGVDLDRLYIFESTTIEDIVETMSNFYPHYSMHIIDSTTNASSLISQKQDMGKSTYGRNALQWKECLRDAQVRWDIKRNLGIMVHQFSQNQRTGGQQSTSTTYMNYVTRLFLRFEHGRFLWERDGVLMNDKPSGVDEQSLAGQEPAHGREVFVKVEKSSVCRPHLVAGLQWSYKRGHFVWVHELAMSALYYGFARRSGSHYYVVRPSGEDERVGQGMKSLYARLADDEELRMQVACRLLDHVGDD